MNSIIQLLISIIDAIKAWFQSKGEKNQIKEEKVAKAESELHEAVENGDLSDLYNSAKNLKKTNK